MLRFVIFLAGLLTMSRPGGGMRTAPPRPEESRWHADPDDDDTWFVPQTAERPYREPGWPEPGGRPARAGGWPAQPAGQCWWRCPRPCT